MSRLVARAWPMASTSSGGSVANLDLPVGGRLVCVAASVDDGNSDPSI